MLRLIIRVKNSASGDEHVPREVVELGDRGGQEAAAGKGRTVRQAGGVMRVRGVASSPLSINEGMGKTAVSCRTQVGGCPCPASFWWQKAIMKAVGYLSKETCWCWATAAAVDNAQSRVSLFLPNLQFHIA